MLYANSIDRHFNIFQILHCDTNGKAPKGKVSFEICPKILNYSKTRLQDAKDVSVMGPDVYAWILQSGLQRIVKTTGDEAIDKINVEYQKFFNLLILKSMRLEKKEEYTIKDIETHLGYEILNIESFKSKTTADFIKALKSSIRERLVARFCAFSEFKGWDMKTYELYKDTLIMIDLACVIEYVAYKQATIRKNRKINSTPKRESLKELPLANLDPVAKPSIAFKETKSSVEIDNRRYYAFVKNKDNEFEYIRDTLDVIKYSSEKILFQSLDSMTIKEFKSKVIEWSRKNKEAAIYMKWQKNVLCIKDNNIGLIDDIVKIFN